MKEAQQVEALRQGFEKWARSRRYSLGREEFQPEHYEDDDTQIAWHAWQAARRAPAAPVPQGWKLVPVELLERIQESLGSFVSDQGWSQSDMDTADALDGLLAAAPQPPEGLKRENHATKPEAGCSVSNGETKTAPVVLPDPEFYADDRGYEVSAEWLASDDATSDYREVYTIPRYTEQQVRELLAAHSIKVKA